MKQDDPVLRLAEFVNATWPDSGVQQGLFRAIPGLDQHLPSTGPLGWPAILTLGRHGRIDAQVFRSLRDAAPSGDALLALRKFEQELLPAAPSSAVRSAAEDAYRLDRARAPLGATHDAVRRFAENRRRLHDANQKNETPALPDRTLGLAAAATCERAAASIDALLHDQEGTIRGFAGEEFFETLGQEFDRLVPGDRVLALCGEKWRQTADRMRDATNRYWKKNEEAVRRRVLVQRLFVANEAGAFEPQAELAIRHHQSMLDRLHWEPDRQGDIPGEPRWDLQHRLMVRLVNHPSADERTTRWLDPKVGFVILSMGPRRVVGFHRLEESALRGYIIEDPYLAWIFEESLWQLWCDARLQPRDLQPGREPPIDPPARRDTSAPSP